MIDISKMYKRTQLNKLCIGCGVCVALCPKEKIYLKFINGMFLSEKNNDIDCASKCNICKQTCPFVDNNPDEREIAEEIFCTQLNRDVKYDKYVGYFLSTYIGYVNDEKSRLNSASGGLATWFLTKILTEKIVDYVVCVSSLKSPHPLFEYAIYSDKKLIEKSSRSAYYPVELSKVLKQILATEGRYAVICLPCYAKAIRLACNINPKLKKRIVCIVGIVCGHGITSYFTEYIAHKAQISLDSLRKITYRTKSRDHYANDHGIDCCWLDKNTEIEKIKRIYWSEGPGELWNSHLFTPMACLFCDDIFAETADIVFMDAWLKEYKTDYRGTSCIIIRSEIAQKICEKGKKLNEITLNECSIDKIIKSQQSVINFKRNGLQHRLWYFKKQGKKVPKKRVYSKKEINIIKRRLWELQIKNIIIGKKLWEKDKKHFETYFIKFIHKKNRLQKLQKLISLFYRGLKKLFFIKNLKH